MCQNNLNFACIPFNFSQFETVTEQTGDIHSTLLYAMLRFQTQHSKLFTHGKQTIARSREQLATFLNVTPSKIDTLIKKLEGLNFIKKTVSTWFCKRRLPFQTKFCTTIKPFSFNLSIMPSTVRRLTHNNFAMMSRFKLHQTILLC